MRNLLIVLSSILSTLFFYSCSKDKISDTIVSEDFITLSEDTIIVGNDGGSVDIKIESSENWRLVNSPEWIQPSKVTGKTGESLILKILPCEENKFKDSTLKLFSGSSVSRLVVLFVPTVELDLLSDSEVVLPSGKSILKIIVNSNREEFEYSFSEKGEEWIKPLDVEDSFDRKVLLFSIDDNHLYKKRISNLKISKESLEVNVKISQEQLNGILPEKLFYETDLAGQKLSVKLKTNIEYVHEFNYEYLPYWMTIVSDEKIGEVGEDGLQEREIIIELQETSDTRKGILPFYSNNEKIIEISIKQQNPNPEWIYIKDPVFREKLHSDYFIYSENLAEEKCEILSNGKNETYLSISNYDDSAPKVESLEGIENFTELTSIDVTNNNLSVFDISLLSKVTSVTVSGNKNLAKITLGKNQISWLSIDYLFNVTEVVVSSENVSYIWGSYTSYNEEEQDKLGILDVSQCPKLRTLNVERENLKTIYISKEQEEKVNITKNENTQVVVK